MFVFVSWLTLESDESFHCRIRNLGWVQNIKFDILTFEFYYQQVFRFVGIAQIVNSENGKIKIKNIYQHFEKQILDEGLETNDCANCRFSKK